MFLATNTRAPELTECGSALLAMSAPKRVTFDRTHTSTRTTECGSGLFPQETQSPCPVSLIRPGDKQRTLIRKDTTLDQSQIAEFVNARCHQDEEDAVSAPPSRNHVVAPLTRWANLSSTPVTAGEVPRRIRAGRTPNNEEVKQEDTEGGVRGETCHGERNGASATSEEAHSERSGGAKRAQCTFEKRRL